MMKLWNIFIALFFSFNIYIVRDDNTRGHVNQPLKKSTKWIKYSSLLACLGLSRITYTAHASDELTQIAHIYLNS